MGSLVTRSKFLIVTALVYVSWRRRPATGVDTGVLWECAELSSLRGSNSTSEWSTQYIYIIVSCAVNDSRSQLTSIRSALERDDR